MKGDETRLLAGMQSFKTYFVARCWTLQYENILNKISNVLRVGNHMSVEIYNYGNIILVIFYLNCSAAGIEKVLCNKYKVL